MDISIKKSSILVNLIFFIYLYVLFAPDRMKNSFSLTIEGKNVTNEIWLVPVILLLSYFIIKTSKIRWNLKNNMYIGIGIYFYIVIISIGGLHAFSVPQFFYAAVLFIVPIFLFFVVSHLEKEHIENLIKRFVVINLIYATFAIVLSTNYAFFMDIVGNPVDDYRYYTQYRPSMMLGSSITVSYYLNLTLPFCIYLFFSSDEKKWRQISVLAVVVNIIATLVLLSRNAALTMIIVVMLLLLFVKAKNSNYTTKVIIVTLLVISGFLAISQYDLSRLFSFFNATGSSIIERLTASSLGLYIFSKYPLFGSGVGSYFERVYEDKYISIDGVSGLIDPHNMYILLLSELGSIGFIVTVFIIIILFNNFSNIKNKYIRRTAYITLVAALINGMGGSQLVNEISYAVIFWVYMGLYNAISISQTERVKT